MTLRPLSPSRRAARGFTLIELGIVVAIFALVVLVVVPSVQAAFGVQTREHTGKLAGAIRAMYGESVLSGRTCRLVFDLDEASWWPECAEGRVRVASEEKSLRGKRIEEVARAVGGTEEQEAARREIEAKNAFSAWESGLAPKTRLPDGVWIDGIWTQHQTEVYKAGQAYLYFFPNGQTERAYVYVADDGDAVYTIVVTPMTGRTKVLPGRVEVPEREMRP